MKIATLSSRSADLATSDEHLFIDPLKKKGIIVETVNWDEPRDWSQYDYVLIRRTWDYMDKLDKFLNVLEIIDKDSTLLNPLDTIKWNINKKYLLELQNEGIKTIPTDLYNRIDSTNIEEVFTKSDQGEGIIIKPTVGASSSGIQFITKIDDFKGELNGEWLVQPFQKNITLHGEYSLLFFGGEFSHAICKLPKEGEFRSQEEFDSTITPWTPTPDALELCSKVLKNLKHETIYARVDMVLNENKEYVLMELELIEPCLFLNYEPEKAINFSNVLLKKLT